MTRSIQLLLDDVNALHWPRLTLPPVTNRITCTSRSLTVNGNKSASLRVRTAQGKPVAVTMRSRTGHFRGKLIAGHRTIPIISTLEAGAPSAAFVLINLPQRSPPLDFVMETHSEDFDVFVRTAVLATPTQGDINRLKHIQTRIDVLLDAASPTSIETFFVEVKEALADSTTLLGTHAWEEALVWARTLVARLHKLELYATSAELARLVAAWYRQTRGVGHVHTIHAYGHLAMSLKYTVHLTDAPVLERLVLQCFLATPHTPAANVVGAYMELGDSLERLNQMPEARGALDKAYELAGASPSLAPDVVERVLVNYSKVIQELGDWTLAHSLMQKALASREARLPSDHVDLQRARLRLARFALAGAMPLDSLTLAAKAHDVLRGQLPKYSGMWLDSVGILFNCHLAAHDLDGADAVLADAYPRADPNTIGPVLDPMQALLLQKRGRLVESDTLLTKAYQLLEAPSEPISLSCLLAAALGRLDECEHMLIAMLDSALRKARQDIPSFTSRDAELYARELLSSLSLCLSLSGSGAPLGNRPALELKVFELLLVLRNMPFAVSVMARSARTTQQHERSTTGRTHTVERYLDDQSGIRRSVYGGGTTDDWAALYDSLMPQSISSQLGPTSALIIYHAYHIVDTSNDERLGETLGERVVAFSLSTAGLSRIDIGPLEAIDTSLYPLLNIIQGESDTFHLTSEMRILAPRERLLNSSRELASLVLAPVLATLPHVKSLWLMPAEGLTMLPFDCLAYEGGFLMDYFDVHLLASLLAPEASPAPFENNRVLLVGGLNYDHSAVPEDLKNESVGPASRMMRSGTFDYLPGTLDEVTGINDSLEIAGDTIEVDMLMGGDCGKSTFMSRAGQYSVLHIATHGHSMEVPVDSRPARGSNSLLYRRTSPYVVQPLEFVVMALSGANIERDGALIEDGRISGADIADWLPIGQARLCVLSGCELGVGVRAPSIGVMSVQRAFSLAGCEHVIATPVTIPDDDASLFMKRFYETLALSSGMAVHDALKHTKQEFLNTNVPLAAWAGWFLVEQGIALRGAFFADPTSALVT